MFVACGIQHAIYMLSILICVLPGSTIFFHITPTKRLDFRNKKFIERKRMLWFSPQVLSETFPILRRTEWDVNKISIRLYIKYSLIIVRV